MMFSCQTQSLTSASGHPPVVNWKGGGGTNIEMDLIPQEINQANGPQQNKPTMPLISLAELQEGKVK